MASFSAPVSCTARTSRKPSWSTSAGYKRYTRYARALPNLQVCSVEIEIRVGLLLERSLPPFYSSSMRKVTRLIAYLAILTLLITDRAMLT